MYKGLLKQYASYLPVNENTPDVSLMEGNTPLIPLLNISKQLGFSYMVSTKERIRQVLLKIVVWSWQLLRRKKKVQKQSFVHQQVIHQHQPQICGTSWDEMHYRNTGRKDCTWKISASGRLWS